VSPQIKSLSSFKNLDLTVSKPRKGPGNFIVWLPETMHTAVSEILEIPSVPRPKEEALYEETSKKQSSSPEKKLISCADLISKEE